MDIKVLFKLNKRFALYIIGIFPIGILSFFVYFLIFVQKELAPAIVFLVFDVLIIVGLFCSEFYGIRIKNDKLRIISQARVKFCEMEDIEKLYVEFIYDGKFYVCEATLHLLNGKKILYRWKEISSYRGPSLRFKFDEENIYEYKEKLLLCDKIEVEIK